MPLARTRYRELLEKADFARLFNELGWDNCKAEQTVQIPDCTVALTAVAEKRGFVVWLCHTPAGENPLDSNARRRIEREVTKLSHEHLIIFTDTSRSRQIWQWVRREAGLPLRVREMEWSSGQKGEALIQGLEQLYISFEEEETVTLLDVAARARSNVNEKVTKRFYDEFRKQHGIFLEFIEGIPNQSDHEWYASVMLNRLMFVYFIQKKGFLDADTDYLRNRLNRLKAEKQGDRFYSFYRYFLLSLFHDGLGAKVRNPQLQKLIGRVPYLNGGIFDVHQLERTYGKDIRIPDEAFESVFDYFDKYQWHLDERPLKADNEINPDVLGYIFEKYINQKQMGAYYTKEDITEYISKSTIIPFIFDAARAKCQVAFENPDGPKVWDLIRGNADRYVFPAVRHGCELGLPDDIANGIDTTAPDLIERRKVWNQPAPMEYALPTEIWRETVARRQRYAEVKRKLEDGEVRDINDFITLNLDIRQFAQDVIQNCEGPDLLMALWQAITTITILDPTGGSGAFLFAALNILEPLYESCLDRMEAFLGEWETSGKRAQPNYQSKFSDVIARIAVHPNRRYFVLKSIILNNLYAVDIMEEAVEICKLRLFLKLAAQVEPDKTKDNLGIEPLPDIDFNIRTGNALVGYATYEEVKNAITSVLDYNNAMDTIENKAADVQRSFDDFRRLQTEGDGSASADKKAELRAKLSELEDELNRYLAGGYGIEASNKTDYANWLQTHQPFHWFIQFHGILTSGGFDVVIGNPPYVNFRKVEYRIPSSYTCSVCSDLFAVCTERSYSIGRDQARLGLIIPLSATSTDTMTPLKQCISKSSASVWTSYFSASDQPASLFTGVRHRLMILLSHKGNHPDFKLQTTRFIKWFNPERDALFGCFIEYARSTGNSFDPFCKLSTATELSVLGKVLAKKSLAHDVATVGTPVYYHNAPVHWGKVFDFVPHFRVGAAKPQQSSHLKSICFQDDTSAKVALCLLNSSLFYWFNWQYSNCRDLSSKDVFRAPLDIKSMSPASMKQLASLATELMDDFRRHKSLYSRVVDGVTTEFDSFYPAKSKAILDEIDQVLAGHYGFTAEELDFIINYDIKYRMGRNKEEEE
jgi:hypothetical protein